jgi:hypothetical protein
VAEAPAGLCRALCLRRLFTKASAAVRARGRVTERLREQAGSGNRLEQPGGVAEYGVTRRTAHQALVVPAARWLPEPEPTSRPGVRWISGLAAAAGT